MAEELHPALGDDHEPVADAKRKFFYMYIVLLVGFLTIQFGHGSNVGVAVSWPGDSKAMNLALGSWVMVGVSLGLPLAPWTMRTCGPYRVFAACLLIDIAVILLMLIPDIGLEQIYAVRFLVGFFEAPILPYLQEWLALFGRHNWTIWNTVLHATVPVGENLGYIIAQELVENGISWQWAFTGQAVTLVGTVIAACWLGGRRLLDIMQPRQGWDGEQARVARTASADVEEAKGESTESDVVEYPDSEQWGVYWATNVALAAQLGFFNGARFVVRDYASGTLGCSLHTVVFAFSAIALLGPAIGGSVAMSGSCTRPDQWRYHKRTLLFLTGTSSVAAVFALFLGITGDYWKFWPLMFLCFLFAGGVYPAAQGIINIALTSTRVTEASVYQVQCNNLLFAMPLPVLVGKSMDVYGINKTLHFVIALQVLTAFLFFGALVIAHYPKSRGDVVASDPPAVARNTGEDSMAAEAQPLVAVE